MKQCAVCGCEISPGSTWCNPHAVQARILTLHKRRPRPPGAVAEIMALHRQGWSGYRIAKSVGMAETTVQRVLHENGVPIAHRRKGNAKASLREPQYCPGFSLYCPDCPTPPWCASKASQYQDWHCHDCEMTAVCLCRNRHEVAWLSEFAEWDAVRTRNGKAAARYAPKEEA